MNKSFTLIEILVVIVVIGILSAFVLVGMNSITTSANITKGKAFLNSLDNSLLLSRKSEWNFNNLTGTIGQDISNAANFVTDNWSSNHGTASGTPNLEEGSSCVTGKCLSFNGSTDYVSISDPVLGSSAMTV
ncbi:MAG TPA: prepilin-type N-terminal cleavage/methylation domain-containing protein, partial [Candidatus Pacearchaeota archaeon]|nr:prepilin-type N-terminal cleavage/methylation domain-containing protein [Candidatus Pacearchaeota archaeon]